MGGRQVLSALFVLFCGQGRLRGHSRAPGPEQLPGDYCTTVLYRQCYFEPLGLQNFKVSLVGSIPSAGGDQLNARKDTNSKGIGA